MAREADQIAQDYSAMLGSVVVLQRYSTHDKGVMQQVKTFCTDMTTDEKKERVARSNGYSRSHEST